MKAENIELTFQEGSSDKVYQAELREEGSGWIVNFAYGRRGAALATGTKTKEPIEYDKAKKVYDKLVKSKTSKGYQAQGQAASINTTEKEDLGLRPQLLNEITEEDAEAFINDPNFCGQEKFDGRRRMLMKTPDGVYGANKKGQDVALTKEITADCSAITSNYILDGEDLGDKVRIFDEISKPGETYKQRFTNAANLTLGSKHLVIVETAWNAEEKQIMYDRLKAENAEGMVFKNIHALFTPGRPASGGNQYKCKFYESASCIVNTVSDTKSSISVAVFDENQKAVPVGNVTVYPNQDMPKVGDVVEVKYLYFYPEGSLYQPVLLGVRDDVDYIECLLSKLKLKQDADRTI